MPGQYDVSEEVDPLSIRADKDFIRMKGEVKSFFKKRANFGNQTLKIRTVS